MEESEKYMSHHSVPGGAIALYLFVMIIVDGERGFDSMIT